MRKKNYFFTGLVWMLSGAVLQPALADDARQKEYQFPPANTQTVQQGAVIAQNPVYTYPQVMAPSYRQPMYYGYPANTAYNHPQLRQGQPMAAVPYRYPQAYVNRQQVYPGMMAPQSRQSNRQMAQAVQPNYQYRSPYNPNIPATPGPKPPPKPQPKKEIKPWGDTRYIWPDFYTDFTGDFWDEMINAPYKMGYMPGGWRFPSLSSPDPVTVGDAVANQVPPILDESANFINFAN